MYNDLVGLDREGNPVPELAERWEVRDNAKNHAFYLRKGILRTAMIRQGTRITAEVIEQVKAFHGHMCPGLALGIRVAEVALEEIGPHAQDEEVVAVVETDMCAVDAIQYLTGCTFGKGNLIHLDYGKNAFSFYRRRDGKSLRLVVRPGGFGPDDAERQALFQKVREGTATEEERRRFQGLHEARARWILEAPLEVLFERKEAPWPLPRPARIHTSIVCEECGEPVMETRIRRFGGRFLCIPCHERLDRRFLVRNQGG